jgi:hypothetical protein
MKTLLNRILRELKEGAKTSYILRGQQIGRLVITL